LTRSGFPRVDRTLITCALEGERLGAGSAHADNIAPSLYGGLVLVRCPSPPDVVRLPVPAGLTAVVVHPHLDIESARARALIGDTVRLADAVRQWANLGALVDGLHRGDFSLISRSLEDFIAEPLPGVARAGAGCDQARALDAGALGCSLSGSGPAIFALCANPEAARRVADAMTVAVRAEIGGDADLRVPDRLTGRPRPLLMRFVTTRGLRQAEGVSFHAALVEGLGPDGGLYMPERIEPWSREEPVACRPAR
jgi:homoserine kinase